MTKEQKQLWASLDWRQQEYENLLTFIRFEFDPTKVASARQEMARLRSQIAETRAALGLPHT